MKKIDISLISAADQVWKVCGYVRLSHEDGDKEESNSVTGQKELIRYFLRLHPELVECSIRVDDGFSGSSFDRPAFCEMMEDVKAGRINCIVVKDLSRFGRNYLEAGNYIERIFPFLGVRFIAINDNYDSLYHSAAADGWLIPFKNILNEAYCRDISVKVRSQIAARERQGRYIGSFPVFGYVRDQRRRGRLVIDESAAGVVREIFAMKLAGENNRQIADKLNQRGVPSPAEYKAARNPRYIAPFQLNPQAKWFPATVERILKNEMYTGTMVQGREGTLNYKIKKRVKAAREDWIRVEDTHKPIVSREEYALVQKLLRSDTRTPPGARALYPFAGLLFCGDCGQSMVRRKLTVSGRTYPYYICSENKRDKTVCSSHRIREDKLSEAVFTLLMAHGSLFCPEKFCSVKELPEGKRETEFCRRRLVFTVDKIVIYRADAVCIFFRYRDEFAGNGER